MYRHKNGVRFRKLDRGDLPRLLALKQESWPTTHHAPILNAGDQDRWFAAIPGDSLYMICSASSRSGDPEDVGLLTLNAIDHVARTATIGGSIFEGFRGTPWSRAAWEGGTDFAFEMLNFNRLDAEVVEYNLAALKMDLRIGFRVEGRRRQAVYKCGRLYDSLVLGLLRDEWRATERVRALGSGCNANFPVDPGRGDSEAGKVKALPEDLLSLLEIVGATVD